MKKILLLLLIISGITNAQEFKTDEKSVTGIFEVKDKTKSEIFSSINKWIAIHYNSAKNVIQMSDLEAGTIIVKGINSINYKNPNYIVYTNTKEYLKMDVNHLLEINIKDHKFRIVYTLTDVDKQPINATVIPELLGFYLSNLDISHISLIGISDEMVLKYSNNIEKLLKMAWVGKEKREKIMSQSRPMLKEVNNSLVEEAKKQMISIEKSITNISSSDW